MSGEEGVSRREFLKIAGIAGAAVGLGGIGGLVAACGGETTTTTAAGAATTAGATSSTASTAAGAMVPTGDLILAVDSLGNEVWAPDVGSSTDQHLMNGCWETLAYINEEGQPFEFLPRLADSWTTSSDGLTWDFMLRKGIQWQGGYGEFTADDVVYSFQLIGGPGSKRDVPLQIGEGNPVKSVEAIDPYHFRLTLNKPAPTLMDNITDDQCSIVCKAHFEKLGHDTAMKQPIGTGPWRFVDYQAGNFMKFEAVENHWRKTPAFKTYTVNSVPELSARMAMLSTGQADISQIPPDKTADAEGAGLHLKEVPGASAFAVALGGSVLPSRPNYDPTCPWVYNADEPWTSDQNSKASLVRQALALAVDKDAIIKTILNGLGTGTPLRDWNLGTDWCRPEWAPYAHDPSKAKQLLEQAGYANGFSKAITMYGISGGGSPLHGAVTQAVATDWQTNLGLKVEYQPIEWSVLRAKTADRDTAWMAYTTGWIVFLEPWLDATYCMDSRNPGFNEGFEHPEMDALLDQVSQEPDLDKRKEYAKELGDFMIDHYVEIGIAVAPAVVACSSKVGPWHLRYLPPSPTMDFEMIEHGS